MKRLITVDKQTFLKSISNMVFSNSLEARAKRHRGCCKDVELIESGELDAKTLSHVDRVKIFSLLYSVGCCSKNKLRLVLKLTLSEIILIIREDEL